jgi:hypothetical protein
VTWPGHGDGGGVDDCAIPGYPYHRKTTGTAGPRHESIRPVPRGLFLCASTPRQDGSSGPSFSACLAGNKGTHGSKSPRRPLSFAGGGVLSLPGLTQRIAKFGRQWGSGPALHGWGNRARRLRRAAGQFCRSPVGDGRRRPNTCVHCAPGPNEAGGFPRQSPERKQTRTPARERRGPVAGHPAGTGSGILVRSTPYSNVFWSAKLRGISPCLWVAPCPIKSNSPSSLPASRSLR